LGSGGSFDRVTNSLTSFLLLSTTASFSAVPGYTVMLHSLSRLHTHRCSRVGVWSRNGPKCQWKWVVSCLVSFSRTNTQLWVAAYRNVTVRVFAQSRKRERLSVGKASCKELQIAEMANCVAHSTSLYLSEYACGTSPAHFNEPPSFKHLRDTAKASSI
jgi:hypothetical protein